MYGNRILKSAVAAILLASAGFACAGSATSNLSVTASVTANCTIATTAVAFGAYDPVVANASTPLDATGTVTIACTKGAGPTITLGLGANASGSTRQMTGTGGLLAYELYQQPSTTPGTACDYSSPTIWGTAGANIFTPTVAPSKTARSYNVCGRVAAGQDVGSGNYSDTVIATVNF
jgi:spore coat protein U-like protein